jgi:hypothetical protein
MDIILIICFATWLAMVLLLARSGHKGVEPNSRERGVTSGRSGVTRAARPPARRTALPRRSVTRRAA